MKVAVSIPDPIFAQAELLAKRSNLSRSGLYARALSDYVDRHSPDEITEMANAAADAMAADDMLKDSAARLSSYRTTLQHTEW